MPIYNAADTLRACIESVLTQPFKDFELILIDDGSTDHSHSICQQFAQTDQRITVHSQPNAGPSQSRNNGLEIAQGLYVTFVDSDDNVAPAFYPIAMASMRKKARHSKQISPQDLTVLEALDLAETRYLQAGSPIGAAPHAFNAAGWLR